LAVLARDVDDADAVRRHLDLDKLRRHVRKANEVLTREAGEHDLFVRVFVIDAEQPALASSSGKNAM
jgi:hypothetical protein